MYDDPEREQRWRQQDLDAEQERAARAAGIPYTRPGADWCVHCGATTHTSELCTRVPQVPR
jgi:hypothetical protein